LRAQRGRWLEVERSQRVKRQRSGAALLRSYSRWVWFISACMGQSRARERQRPHPAMPPPDDECRCWRGSCWKDTLGRADMAPALGADPAVAPRGSLARARGCHARARGARKLTFMPLIRSLQSWHMPR